MTESSVASKVAIGVGLAAGPVLAYVLLERQGVPTETGDWL
jgi:hypothetical protein